jgi:hypothetical protein
VGSGADLHGRCRSTPAHYLLTNHEDGTEVEFRKQTSGQTQVGVVDTVRTLEGEANETRYAFDLLTVDGVVVRRPTRMLAPTPGVSCDLNATLSPPSASLKGCRMLVFSYDAGTEDDTSQITVGVDLAGARPDRINAADLIARDPATAAMKRTTLVRYDYGPDGRRSAAAWGWAYETTPGRLRDHKADVRNNAVGRSGGRRINTWWIGTARKTACRSTRRHSGRADWTSGETKMSSAPPSGARTVTTTARWSATATAT